MSSVCAPSALSPICIVLAVETELLAGLRYKSVKLVPPAGRLTVSVPPDIVKLLAVLLSISNTPLVLFGATEQFLPAAVTVPLDWL